MPNQPLFSVIMPVYNSAHTLQRAADSILQQEFQNFELVLVNDGSKDDSPQLCAEIARTHKQAITVSLKPNQGLSAARNAGLRASRGQYILFLDSDDYVEPSLLADLAAAVSRHRPDLIVFGLVEEHLAVDGSFIHTRPFVPQKALLEGDAAVRQNVIDLEAQTLLGYAWNKLYDAQVLREHNIRFQSVTLIEDILFNIEYMDHVQRMLLLPEAYYHYIRTPDVGLTGKNMPDYFELNAQRVQAILNQHKKWKLDSAKARAKLADIYTRYVFSALERMHQRATFRPPKEREAWLRELWRDPLYLELAPYMRSKNRLVGIMGKYLRKKRTRSCLAVAAVVHLFRNRFPTWFVALRQNR